MKKIKKKYKTQRKKNYYYKKWGEDNKKTKIKCE